MPGCTCETDEADKDMYLSSYDDLVLQLKTTDSALTNHEIRLQAAHIFRRRYRQNKASEVQEAAGLPEYEIGQFTLTDTGEVKYLEYGSTLEEMQSSQIRQRSNEYSPEGHQTSRMIEEAFRNGATIVTTAYVRKDNDHRDVVVMRYDPVTRIGITSIITAATDGRFHTFDTIRSFAQKRFSNLQESKPAKNVFILSDVKVGEKRGHEIIRDVQRISDQVREVKPIEQRGYWRQEKAKTEKDAKLPDNGKLGVEQNKQSYPHNTPRPDAILGIVKQGEYIGKRLSTDISKTTSQVMETIRKRKRDQVKRVEGKPSFFERLTKVVRGQFVKGEEEKNDQRIEEKSRLRNEDLLTVDTENQEIHGPSGKSHMKAKEALGIIILASQDEEMQEVFMPSVFVALNELAYSRSLLIDDEGFLEEEDSIVLTPELHEAIGVFFTQEEEEETAKIVADSLESTRQQRFAKHCGQVQVSQEPEGVLRAESIDVVALSWVRDLVQDIDQDSPEQAVEKITDEEKGMLIQMCALWDIFAQMNEERRLKPVITNRAIPSESISRLQSATGNETEDMQKEEREHVEDFSFAFTVWMLLKLNSYYRSLQSLKDFIVGDTVSVLHGLEAKSGPLNLLEKLKVKLPEGLIQKETSQWILLAILWHMHQLEFIACLREAGLRQRAGNRQQVTSKKKKYKKSVSLQKEGVIFAFQ